MLKWLGVAAAVAAVDQLTKRLAEALLDYGRPVELLSWFNLTLAYNRGAAFSFLSEASGWQRWFFVTVGLVAVAAIGMWLKRLGPEERLTAAGLSLVLGGAVGNLVDRLWLGHVVDFIDWHYGGWHWPAFNLADSAITVGVALLLLGGLREGGRHHGRA